MDMSETIIKKRTSILTSIRMGWRGITHHNPKPKNPISEPQLRRIWLLFKNRCNASNSFEFKQRGMY